MTDFTVLYSQWKHILTKITKGDWDKLCTLISSPDEIQVYSTFELLVARDPSFIFVILSKESTITNQELQ